MTPEEAVSVLNEKGLVAEVSSARIAGKDTGVVLVGGKARRAPTRGGKFAVYSGEFHIKVEDLGDNPDGNRVYSYLARFPAPAGLHLCEVRHNTMEQAVRNIVSSLTRPSP